MLERDPKTLIRLQAVMTALIEHRVATSLVDVERALARWRNGAHSALAVHGVVLRHAARCERTVDLVTAAAGDRPEGILRDAVDAGLVSEQEFVELVGKTSRDVATIGVLLDESDASPADKRRTLEAMLARGPVLIHIDARRTEVLVPPQLRADPSLVLRFGYHLSPAIPDLTVNEDAIAGTLTFHGQPFHCVLPWTAIYVVRSEGEPRAMIWAEDVPEDVLTRVAPPPETPIAPTAAPMAKPAEEPRMRGHLKLVE